MQLSDMSCWTSSIFVCLVGWFCFSANGVIPHLKPSLPKRASSNNGAPTPTAPNPPTHIALGNRICLVHKLSNSGSALPGRAQPPRPVNTATALSGQGHLGDTKHLSYTTTRQAKAGYSLSFPLVAPTNSATRVILFRSPSPA